MADSLYGVKQASKTKAKDISSSTSLAFSSNLASLISSTSSNKDKSASGRPRPSKSKSDIFTAHNKNVKKRSATDLEQGQQHHKTKDDVGSVDTAELHRSKRKMEDKVRLYNAMKRGEYLGKAGRDDPGLVDFDRKWAEKDTGRETISSDASDSEDGNVPDNEEVVEYLDEFGRLRKGTKSQAAREERRRTTQAHVAEEDEQSSARPTMPSNVIFGDTIQHSAFNPDQVIADRMSEIAKKRDKSATPPPDTHFDAAAEVRTKGTGFYAFSQDTEERRREMEALQRERSETEKVRQDREDKMTKRRKEIEERRKLIATQRAKAQTDKFLDELEIEEV